MTIEGIIAGSVIGAATGAAMLGWNWINEKAHERNMNKVQVAKATFGNKILRHSPTGQVGRCIAVGCLEQQKALGKFKANIVGILVVNDDIIPAAMHPPMMEQMINEGYVLMVAINELAAALPEEVEAYTN